MNKSKVNPPEEKLSTEERQIVDFFKGLIPILREVVVDLEKKGRLHESDFANKVPNNPRII